MNNNLEKEEENRKKVQETINAFVEMSREEEAESFLGVCIGKDGETIGSLKVAQYPVLLLGALEIMKLKLVDAIIRKEQELKKSMEENNG